MVVPARVEKKMADLSKTPLVALSIDTRILLSTLLNPIKWLPTDDGLPRDWRGLAHLWEIGGETIPSLASHSDPTGQLLTFLQDKKKSCTIQDFQSILAKIDRWDVVDDALSLMERDALRYLERIERCSGSVDEIQAEVEKEILTMDDLYRVKQGMESQNYDAFVLYAEEDLEFVNEMIDILENRHGLKLCLKDRDLVGGIPFEHEAVMRLISERCNRLIVVISPDFLKSPANSFFLNYAQAVGIGTGQRKIIPCLYKKCQLPPQLAYQFILDYSRKGLYDFWGRLNACVQVVVPDNSTKRSLPTQQSSCHSEKRNCQRERPSESVKNSVDCSDITANSLKKINGTKCAAVTDKKSDKSTKTKKIMIWSKGKRGKNGLRGVKEIEPVTESVSITLSLPSLDNLPSLDTIESPASHKPTKRWKSLVNTCLNKVQSLVPK